MAVQPYTQIPTQWYGDSAIIFRWVLSQNDTGAPVRIPFHADITCQARGTFGAGGTILFQGTMDDSTTPVTGSYGTLHQPDMSTCSVTVTGSLVQVLEHSLQIRPNCTAGDGTTSITVDILVVKQWKG